MKYSSGSYTEYVKVNGYTQEITFERQEDFNLAKACVLNDLQGVKDAVEIEEKQMLMLSKLKVQLVQS